VKAADYPRTAFSTLIVTCTDMFTKLKNKIAEEVKQSPLKLSASVQQLTQVCSMYQETWIYCQNLQVFSQFELLFDCSASECDNSVS